MVAILACLTRCVPAVKRLAQYIGVDIQCGGKVVDGVRLADNPVLQCLQGLRAVIEGQVGVIESRREERIGPACIVVEHHQ